MRGHTPVGDRNGILTQISLIPKPTFSLLYSLSPQLSLWHGHPQCLEYRGQGLFLREHTYSSQKHLNFFSPPPLQPPWNQPPLPLQDDHNSLLTGLPAPILVLTHSILNTAAKVILLEHRLDHSMTLLLNPAAPLQHTQNKNYMPYKNRQILLYQSPSPPLWPHLRSLQSLPMDLATLAALMYLLTSILLIPSPWNVLPPDSTSQTPMYLWSLCLKCCLLCEVFPDHTI